MAEVLFKDESYAIMGAAFEVYNHLGPGFAEAVYQECLSIEFGLRNIPFQAQCPLQITYKEHKLEQVFRPDFVVYDQIIVEIKAVQRLGPNEDCQLMNYLRATGLRLGLLLNFANPGKLGWKRIAC